MNDSKNSRKVLAWIAMTLPIGAGTKYSGWNTIHDIFELWPINVIG